MGSVKNSPSLKLFSMNKTVKITRDCLALGEHRDAGSIVALPEKTCRELVTEGAAAYFETPQPQEIENAEITKRAKKSK